MPTTAHTLLASQLLADAAAIGPSFGDRKVFLCHLMDLTDAEACLQLQELHASGLVVLARADLVAAMDPDLVAASEWTHPAGPQFHFLVLPVAG